MVLVSSLMLITYFFFQADIEAQQLIVFDCSGDGAVAGRVVGSDETKKLVADELCDIDLATEC